MNAFNRVLVVLLLVGLIVVLVIALAQPAPSLELLRTGVVGLQALAATNLYLYLAVGLAKLALAFVLLLLELRRPRRATVKVQRASGAAVELTTESVARGIEYHVSQVPGVTRVRPNVVSTGKAVKVVLDLETDAAADVAAKSDEVVELAREIIEGKLGVRLARITANVRQAAYPGSLAPAGRGVRPAEDAPVEAPPAAPPTV